jgi:sec-independent protein translocase protein TatA
MGEGLFQPMHLLVIFAIALVVFGPKKLPELGKGLGDAIREFKNSFRAGDVTSDTQPPGSTPHKGTGNPTVPPEQPKM